MVGMRRRRGGAAVLTAAAACAVLLLAAAEPAASEDAADACAAAKDVSNATSCNPHYAKPQCDLLSNALGYFLQVLLAFVGFVSLLVKKLLEERRTGRIRTYRVWGLDVSKQAAASICAHVAAMINSGILDNMNIAHQLHDTTYILNTDKCSWYFTSFTLDTTLGVFLSYCMFRLQAKLTSRYPGSCIGALGQSGDYMDQTDDEEPRVNYQRWGAQLSVWCIITVAARMMVLGVQALLFPMLRHFVGMIAQTMACKPNRMLMFVMVACPVLMNIMMLWIQDQFLKQKPEQDEGSPSGPEGSLSGPPATKKRNYRKTFCNWVLIGVMVLAIGGTMLFYVVYVGAEQGNYDHCYTQVRKTIDQNDPQKAPLKDEQVYYASHPIPHNFSLEHKKCANDDSVRPLKDFLEHRGELIDMNGANRSGTPKCQCCNIQSVSSGSDVCTDGPNKGEPRSCSGVGKCCGRSLLHNMDKELVDTCSVCPIYLPCDQAFCPARPDFIRNAQHIPLLLGVFLSFLGNGYVLYTYSFDSTLQKATITKLLSCASVVELIKSASLLAQEMLFRIPRQPCYPTLDTDGNGVLDAGDCAPPPQWHDWPTWKQVEEFSVRTTHSNLLGQPFENGQRGGAVALCEEMSFIYQFTWTAYDSYFWMITVDLVLNLYTSPFGAQKRWHFYHGWTLTFSLVLSVWLIAVGDWGVSYDSILEDFCWNVNWGQPGLISGSTTSFSNSHILMPTVYGLSAFYYLTSLIGAVVAYCKVGKLTQGLREAREDSIKEGGQVVFLFSAWQLCFCCLYFWVLHQTHDIVKRVNWQKGPRQYSQEDEPIVWIWAFVLGARNCINFVVWKFVVIPRHNKAYQSELIKMTKEYLSDAPSESSDAAAVAELNEVLKREILFFTGLGIRSAVRFPYGEHNAGRPASHADLLEHLNPSDCPDPKALEWNIDLKEASEYEDEHHTTFARGMSRLFATEADPVDGPDHDVNDREKQREKEEQERLEHLTQFKFKTYQPAKFRKLRELFGMEPRGDDGTQSLLLQAMESHEEGSFSGGASGMFMYYSGDRRFIVKQITEAEKDVMLEILDGYINHMEDSRGEDGQGPISSLLLRVVQLNRIQMYQHEVCGQAVMQGYLYFVVTENCFYQPLLLEMELMKGLPQHEGKTESELRDALKRDLEVYDLKGSWVGRSTAFGSDGRKWKAAGETQKDLDLQEPLYLRAQDKQKLTQQLEADSRFLSTHNIMDYSLLLGIKKGISSVTADSEAGAAPDPVIYHAAAAHHSQRYFMGIIDILQQWDGSKKRETFFKTFCLGKDPEGLSSMEPVHYQQRFVEKMGSHISEEAPDTPGRRHRSASLMSHSMRHLMVDESTEPTRPQQAGGGGAGAGGDSGGVEMFTIGSE